MTTPVDHVAMQARLQPNNLAVVELATGKQWTYAAFDDLIARCATVLRNVKGCAVGDRVACLAKNRHEYVLLHFACARIGAIFIPLNWRLNAAEISDLISDCEPKLLLVDAEFERLGFQGVPFDWLADMVLQAEPAKPELIDETLPSLILYTSGTSGRPKGVLLSEHNMAQTAINFGVLGQVTHKSAFLIDVPLYHVLGLVGTVRPAFMRGGKILISDGFVPERTMMRMSDPSLGVTHYFCAPQMAQMIRQQPGFDPKALRGLTALFTGGAPHPAADIRAWLADGITVTDGLGMSEAAGAVFGMPVDHALISRKAGSVGVPTPAVRVRVVDDEDRDCPPGVPGELLLKGENVFSGYWKRPEETAKAFTSDHWFRTGDIAVCDEDGFYTLVDRKKDMFISGGENVYPAEIEAAIAGYPGLVEVAVVGVPDQRWGEVGHMAIVAAAGGAIDQDAVILYLTERIARYKLPKHITLVAALPRTGSGKVQKAVLRTMLLESMPVAQSSGELM